MDLMRLPSAVLAAALLVPAHTRASGHVYPEGVAVAVGREYESLLIMPGIPLELTVRIDNLSASSLRGLVFTEHIPAAYDVETIGVSIDGAPLADYLYEVSTHDVYPETNAHHWILEEPGRYEERANPLPAGSSLVISCRLSGTSYLPFEWPPYFAAWEADLPAGEYGFAWCDETLVINDDGDDDGMGDAFEVRFFGDLSHDGTADGDGDWLNDLAEYRAGTDPTSLDTDGDGLSDGDEVSVRGTNPLASDTDGDELNDGAEVHVWGTDPLSPDSDGDLLGDGDEVVRFGTDPNLADSDGDGVGDRDEVGYDGDPSSYAPYDPDAGPSGTDLDARRPDTDRDGYSDLIESHLSTDPLDGGATPAVVPANFQPPSSRRPSGFLSAGTDPYSARGFGWR